MKNPFKSIIHFFDKLEDHVRGALSRYPIIYTCIGGFAIVLFWRGVWMTADYFPFLNGPVSIVVSVGVLLITGLFVSFFISDRIILTGWRQEKKLVEKAASEVREEETILNQAMHRLATIESHIANLDRKIDNLK